MVLSACDAGFQWEFPINNQARTEINHPDPSLRTRRYHLPGDVIFTAVLNVLDVMPRWQLVRQDRHLGQISAERKTDLFHFVDDVQIKIEQIHENETTLNLHSASRVGKSDFGQNARNIRAFLEVFDEQISAVILQELDQADLLKKLPDRLKHHVETLAIKIGERHFSRPKKLEEAADYIASTFKKAQYPPEFEPFQISSLPGLTALRSDKTERALIKEVVFKNVVAKKAGSGDGVIVVGAHYDTVVGSPGADDNASGVAVLLETARLLQAISLKQTIVFVAFANEETPFFRTDAMGSAQFVKKALQEKMEMTFMISLEMLGFYSDAAHSQSYPPFLKYFYPDKANFIAVVGNPASRKEVRKMTRYFHQSAHLPVESLVAPGFVPGVDFSNQLNFWKKDIPAVMLTDTAYNRNPNYHTPNDLPRTLHYQKMSQITRQLVYALLVMGKVTGSTNFSLLK